MNNTFMEKSELNFKDGNPGAVQFGNFINYYKFHSPENRIKLLPLNFWRGEKDFVALDVGCNAGDLTVLLYNSIKENVENCKFLGIDIDPNLIERANEIKPVNNNSSTDIEFICLDFMNEKERSGLNLYLSENGLNLFSVIFCFSITMWIHLNHGDEGLKLFLKEICNLAKCIVIEPQPWKCYKSAVKRMKLSCSEFPFFNQLKIRETVENDIEQILIEECNMCKVYESDRSDWGRKIVIFKRNTNT